MGESLSLEWNNTRSVVLYGAGARSTVVKNIFNRMNISIKYMLDRDPQKQGTLWNGIPIVSYEEIKHEISGSKIVISTGHTAYNGISDYLNRQGLQEFRDYCSFACFFREWFWNVHRMNCIYSLTMTITTQCTLKCKKCNMFIPYYEKPCSFELEELLHNIDLLFQRIDYVAYFSLIGGEPLLSPYLLDILTYLHEHYSERYGMILTTTNGTILPSEILLEYMSKMNILIDVSDYTNAVNYQDRFQQVIALFQKYNISYNIRRSLEWVDFSFPENTLQFSKEELRYHLFCCRPEWSGLNDGKFYFCNVAWSAEKAGLFQLLPSDYIKLTDIDPADKEACHKIVELSKGTCSFCKVCGGCGSDNTNFVVVGEQFRADL